MGDRFSNAVSRTVTCLNFTDDGCGLCMIRRCLYLIIGFLRSCTHKIWNLSESCASDLEIMKKTSATNLWRTPSSCFSRYIYLTSSSTTHELVKNVTPIKKFFVYMFTTSLTNLDDDEPRPIRDASVSTTSLTSKKSTSGNFLTNLIQKAKKKKCESHGHGRLVDELGSRCNDETQTSSKDAVGKSKIPVLKTPSRQPQKSDATIASKSQFFRNSEDIAKVDQNEEICLHYEGTVNADENVYDDLSVDFRDVIDVAKRLREDELHLAHLISKYVRDQDFEKELLTAMSTHAKLYLEAERRSQNLASQMWIQQSEMWKVKEVSMQERLNVLVKQNKVLQEEIDIVRGKNENLQVKLQRVPDRHMSFSDSSSAIVGKLNKNNAYLRRRAGALSDQIEEHEKNFDAIQKKRQYLEQRLKHTNSQLKNYKDLLRRAQTDHELEHACLSSQLHDNQVIIKESAEAGDVLLEDLDALKRQLNNMSFSLNWTKFKSRGSSLPDLLYMCRSCINELAKELSNAHTEILLKEKDVDNLKEEVLRGEEKFEETKREEDRLNEQLRISQTTDLELKKYKSKCNQLENDLLDRKRRMEKVSADFEMEKRNLLESLDEMNDLNKKIVESEEESFANKENVVKLRNENEALHLQLDGLKQILSDSGSANISNELVKTQEDLGKFQSQYYQVLSEKTYLAEQLQTANSERNALSQIQNDYHKLIQEHRQQIDHLNANVASLKRELDAERNQNSLFRAERSKFNEEKNVMKQIFIQLKNEIQKVHMLEGKVVGMNVEANKLAIIAEYNKHVGEKLQTEVAERDVKITELQNNMAEMNNAQVENVKDKVALCVELTEMCSLNDKLNTFLVSEQQNNIHLDEIKKTIECEARLRLREVEEMQRVERTAIKELIENHKNVVAQRDKLLISQTEYKLQIVNLKETINVQFKNVETLKGERKQNRETVQTLEASLTRTVKKMEHLEKKIEDLDKANSEQQRVIDENKNQNEIFESNVAYLQNMLQRLYGDLNCARELETRLRRDLVEETRKATDLQAVLVRRSEDVSQLERQRDELLLQTSELSQSHANLRARNESNMCLENELKTTNELAEKYKENVGQLEKVVDQKDKELEQIQNYCVSLDDRLKHTEATVSNVDAQAELLSESNLERTRLQSALDKLEQEHADTVAAVKRENDKLREDLDTKTKNAEENSARYEQYIDNIITEHANQNKNMDEDLQTLTIKLEELQREQSQEMLIKTKLLEEHEETVAKLLTAVQMLISEKQIRQRADVKIDELSGENRNLITEKAVTDNMLNLLSKELREAKTKIDELAADKNKVEAIACNIRQLKSQINSRCKLKIMRSRSDSSSGSRSELVLEDTNYIREVNERDVEIAQLKQNLTALKFQNSEVTIRVHEIRANLKAEQKINRQLTEMNQELHAEIVQLRKNDKITQPVMETLFKCFKMADRTVSNL